MSGRPNHLSLDLAALNTAQLDLQTPDISGRNPGQLRPPILDKFSELKKEEETPPPSATELIF